MDECRHEEANGSPDLLHLLTCTSCRKWAIGRLLDEQCAAANKEETQEEIFAGLWDRLEERTPELIEESHRRREAGRAAVQGADAGPG
jgi:hypothetical protein